jgi:hypothetical protein
MYDADRAALKAMGNSDPDAVIENARRLGVERRKQQERDHAIVLAALRWLELGKLLEMENEGNPLIDELDDILDPVGLSVATLDVDDINRICEDMNFDN